MKVLFIGGTGIISSACSELAISKGIELTLINRGTSIRPIPSGAEVIQANYRDPDSLKKAIGSRTWDSVVDFISFVPEHIKAALDVFNGKTAQYVFISSASAYRKPPVALPVVESNLLYNPFWEYSRNKIACEEYLIEAYRTKGTPITIVRPSHTYDKTLFPMEGGWTTVDRMLKGQEIVVHGDGSSLWTLTHHRDFAVGLIGLLNHPYAIGEEFHITSDEWLSWNEILRIVGKAVGAVPNMVHVPSETIARFDKQWGDGLLGDKTHSMIFDNSKIKRIVPDFNCSIPFSRGIEEVVAWHKADPTRQKIDTEFLNRHAAILAYHNR